MTLQREPRRKRGFLLGTAIGIAAGVAGGIAMLRQSAPPNTEHVATADGSAAPQHVIGGVQRTSETATEKLRGLMESLQSRWDEAIAEGRKAAIDRRRELKAELAADTKRLPAFEAELLERARERNPMAVGEFERLTSSPAAAGDGKMKPEG